jgi:hypothetical protein
MLKPWTVRTTSNRFASGLAIKCDASHVHAITRGRDAKLSENYTIPLVDKIHLLFKQIFDSLHTACSRQLVALASPAFRTTPTLLSAGLAGANINNLTGVKIALNINNLTGVKIALNISAGSYSTEQLKDLAMISQLLGDTGIGAEMTRKNMQPPLFPRGCPDIMCPFYEGRWKDAATVACSYFMLAKDILGNQELYTAYKRGDYSVITNNQGASQLVLQVKDALGNVTTCLYWLRTPLLFPMIQAAWEDGPETCVDRCNALLRRYNPANIETRADLGSEFNLTPDIRI